MASIHSAMASMLEAACYKRQFLLTRSESVRVFFVFSKKWRGKTENVAGLFSDFIASIPLFSEKQFSENRNKHVFTTIFSF